MVAQLANLEHCLVMQAEIFQQILETMPRWWIQTEGDSAC